MNSEALHLQGEITFRYHLYKGKAMEELPQILNKNQLPLLTSEFMSRLAKVKTHSDKCFQNWCNICPVTGDAIARHRYGSARFIRGTPALWDFMIKSRVDAGVIRLEERQYERLDGLYLPEIKIRKYNGRNISSEVVFSNQIFNFLANEENVLKDFLACHDQDLYGISLPKVRDYTYLTLLGLSNGGKTISGVDLLEGGEMMVGVPRKLQIDYII